MSSNDLLFYFYILVLPLLLPLIIGIVILVGFWKDELSRMGGFFTLKPVLAYPLWFYIILQYFVSSSSESNPVEGFIPLIPGIVLTVIIAYRFRRLIASNQIAKLFLALDVFRWMYTFSLGFQVDPNIWFGLVFPSIYALLAVIIVLVRNRKLSKIESSNL